MGVQSGPITNTVRPSMMCATLCSHTRLNYENLIDSIDQPHQSGDQKARVSSPAIT